jgi:hypothetical protein
MQRDRRIESDDHAAVDDDIARAVQEAFAVEDADGFERLDVAYG